MNKKKHIIDSISKAESGISKLNEDILRLEGLSSDKIRHLLNNLLEIENVNYLEIGTWKGSTLISSIYGNSLNSCYAIDNWSEFSDNDEAKKDFECNIKEFLDVNNIKIFEEDCFKLDLSKIENKIDVYLYDGAHDYESQYNAIKYFYPILNDEFILIVDDYDPVRNWEQVERGTQDAIKDMDLDVIYEKHLKSSGRNNKHSWWNGYYLAILSKN